MQYPVSRRLKPFKSARKAFLLLCMVAGSAQAAPGHDSWYWHAFASQGLIHSSDNNFFGNSDDGVSADFRELGVLLGVEPYENLNLVGQLLSRRAGDVEDTDLRVDYAFASYSFLSDLDRELGLKIGRIRSPLGFFSETRDVAHTRPGILLPQSVYVDRLRSLFFARDGLVLFGSYRWGLNTLSWDFSYGELLIEEEFYPEIVGPVELRGEMDTPFTPMARLLWDWDMGRIRLGLTYSKSKARYDAGAGELFQDADLSLTHWIASAEYNTERWSLTSEYMTYKSNLGNLLPSLTPDMLAQPSPDILGQVTPELMDLRFDTRGYGYYIQGTYRFWNGWDTFLRWDVQYLDKERRHDSLYFTKDVTIGLGWRPDSHWLLRAEWHFVDGKSALSLRENPVHKQQSHWQMVLFQVSYRL